MSVGPLVVEISVTFLIVAFLLHRYGNWSRHHIFVTISVFIAWYFSFIIISILPQDVSTTAYRQCLKDRGSKAPDIVPPENETTISNFSLNSNETTASIINEGDSRELCKIPWSHIPEGVLPILWRVVYWTSQALTWIILPMMQSYSTSGNFTVTGKLRTALWENAIYYGTYLIIFTVLLIYVACLPNIKLDWSKLVVICITASNTWGLFLLVLLLGYSLVEIPRSCWNSSKRGYVLNYLYFRSAKLSTERCEAEEKLEDILEEIQQASENTPVSHPMRPYVDTILAKCPEDKKNILIRRRQTMDESQMLNGSTINERNLARMHKQMIKALQAHHRTRCQWSSLVDRVLHWEDTSRNETCQERVFKSSYSLYNNENRSLLGRIFCTPKLQWYWYCMFRAWVLRLMAIILGLFSAAVVWSEMTFFVESPVISFFAIFINKAKDDYNYVSIEIISILTIAYLCFCAYYTVFHVRVFNYYYLAPHHQTDEYSLIFCGMMLCRLTPPLCLNFLGLIHLDSHVIKDSRIVETAYTSIMGHMDVVAIVSDGFNIYFPMLICLLCLATYFRCGSRLLHLVGFEQFLGDDDEMTADLVDEGRELIKRERTRRQRLVDGEARKRNFNSRFGNQRITDSPRPTGLGGMLRTPSEENARAELLRDVEPIDYTEERQPGRIFSEIRSVGPENVDPYASYHKSMQNIVGRPPRGLFDDV